MHDLDSSWEVIKREYNERLAANARQVRSRTLQDLGTVLGRLRTYRGEADWVRIFADALPLFVTQFAIFTINDAVLLLRAQRGLDLSLSLELSLADAPALATCVTSKDVVTSLRIPGEVGSALSSAAAAEKVFLVPVLNSQRVIAIVVSLLAPNVDTQGVELLAGLAGLVLERQSNTALATHIAPAHSRPVILPEQPQLLGFNDTQRSLHLRARRFARVKVAEIQLIHPDAAKAGREQNDVYLFLKKDIDAARESYRSQFMQNIPRNRSEYGAMIDYLHLELVEVAAEGQEQKLGSDYPGPLA